MPPKPPLILLVDDVEDARDLYSTYLTYKGYRVVCAADGAEAIACARRERPDLVLMDLRMPGMSGTETMRTLRTIASLRDVPVIAVTANALDCEQAEALRAGFDRVLPKPCLPDRVYEAVTAMLQHHGVRDATP